MRQRKNSAGSGGNVTVSQLCRRFGVILLVVSFVAGLVLIYKLEKGHTTRTFTCDTVFDLLDSSNKISKYMLSKNFGFLGTDQISLTLPYERSRLDNHALLRIYDYIRTGNEWDALLAKYDICLTTQASIERLYWLPQVLETWNGPISLATLMVTKEEWLVFNIYSLFLERCYSSFRDRVTIHLTVPVFAGTFYFSEEELKSLNIDQLVNGAAERECGGSEGAEAYLNELLEKFDIPTVKDKDKLALKIVYPQNHLRNLARKGCATHWTFSTDVDIIPRYGMAEMLQEFYEFTRQDKTPCRKCAYVIPTFELDETKSFPKSKMDVVEYFKNDTARQYHGTDYALAQNATDYGRWSRTNLDEGPTRVSHRVVEGIESLRAYEPFYISSDKIPPFDERFLGYGRTRSSQFQEALLARWNFTVLSNVFSIHWGLHSKSNHRHPFSVGEVIRVNQTTHNRHLFEKIEKEMKLRRKEGLYT